MDIPAHSTPNRNATQRKRLGLWLLGVITLLVSISMSMPLRAEPTPPIRVGLFDMPPYYSQDAEGHAVGELIDTLNRTMAQLDYRWQPYFMTVPELLKAVVDGDVDLLMLIKHPMIEQMALYAKNPMGKLTMLAFHTQQQAAVSSLAELRDQRVAIIRGYGYGGMLNQLLVPDNGLRITLVENHREGMQLLAQSKADYLLGYRKPGEAALAQLQLQGIQSDRLNEKPVFFVVSKQAQQQRALLTELERTMAALSGTQQQSH